MSFAALACAMTGAAAIGVAAAFAGSDARAVAAARPPAALRARGRHVAAVLLAFQLALAALSGALGAALALLLGAWTIAGWAFTHAASAWPALAWRTAWWSGTALLAAAVALHVVARSAP